MFIHTHRHLDRSVFDTVSCNISHISHIEGEKGPSLNQGLTRYEEEAGPDCVVDRGGRVLSDIIQLCVQFRAPWHVMCGQNIKLVLESVGSTWADDCPLDNIQLSSIEVLF